MQAVTNTKPFVFKSFQDASKPKGVLSTIHAKRRKVSDEPDTQTKVKIAVGAISGTALPLVLFARHQKLDLKKLSSFFKLEYGLKEMVGVSCGSILGGTLAGMAFDKKNTKKEKMDEGVFQFLNAVVPPSIIAGLIKAVKKSGDKALSESKMLKTGIFATGILGGMPIAVKAANFINDPKDKLPDRKLGVLDAIVNIDDAIGALVLADFPCIKQLHLEKLLPIIYAWCGYRSGETN